MNQENKYYIVPITATLIKCFDISFKKILKEVDEGLYDREVAREELRSLLRDSNKFDKQEFNDWMSSYGSETSLLFRLKKLPEKLVVVDDGGTLSEISTGILVTATNDSYLSIFSATGEESADFFTSNENYSRDALNLFNAFTMSSKVFGKFWFRV